MESIVSYQPKNLHILKQCTSPLSEVFLHHHLCWILHQDTCGLPTTAADLLPHIQQPVVGLPLGWAFWGRGVGLQALLFLSPFFIYPLCCLATSAGLKPPHFSADIHNTHVSTPWALCYRAAFDTQVTDTGQLVFLFFPLRSRVEMPTCNLSTK